MNVQTPMSRDAFFYWLNDGETLLSCDRAMLLKVPKTDDVSYLFLARSYRKDAAICCDDSFSFCGMYARKSGNLRIADTALRKLADGLTAEECLDEGQLMTVFSRRVTRQIEEIIAWDRENLQVHELSQQRQDRLAVYAAYGAAEEATRLFFANKEPAFCIRYDCRTSRQTEDILLSYVQDPVAAVRAEAERYIADNQEELLAAFSEMDILWDAYNALVRDTGGSLYRMREITAAIEASGAKTVSVTVEKDGKELTFKTTAASLKGHRPSYSTYDIATPDRREFERLFGEYTGYTVKDITRIAYNRTTIYEALPVQAEEIGMEGMQFG